MYLVYLDDTQVADASLVGGKGQNLMALVRAGFRVPDGFVVTTRAFTESLRGRLGGRLARDQVREAIVDLELPAPVLQALEQGYAELLRRGWSDFAVRSSAVDEDQLDQSWAGQQDSYVHVRGFEALALHVKRVWASIFGESSLSYHSRDGFATREPAMAVVVQGMVRAEVAGVTFTVNPVSGRRDEMVHTSSYGLGETVVSGGDADVFVVDKATGALRERTIGAKRRMVVPVGQSGTTVADVPEPQVAQASLADGQVAELTRVGRGVEAAFGGPQDVEWAWEGGRLFVLQARPITAGKDLGRAPEGGAVWTNANVGEALPGVGTPFTWSIIGAFARVGFERALGALGLDVPAAPMVRNVYGRVYLNQTALLEALSSIPFFAPERVLMAAGGTPFQQAGYTRRSSLPFLMRLPVKAPQLALNQYAIPVQASLWRRRVRRRIARVEAGLGARPTKREVAALLEDFSAEVFTPTGTLLLGAASNALSSYVLVSLVVALLGGRDLAGVETRLIAGLDNVKSAQPGLVLLRLARIVKNQPDLYRLFRAALPSDEVVRRVRSEAAFKEFRRELERFLADHGHRAPLEAEIATPRWGDRPDTVVDLLRSYLQVGEPPDPTAFIKARVRERVRTEAQVKARVGAIGRLLLGVLLPRAQDAARLREELRDLVVKTLSIYRKLGLEAGRHLVADGVAGCPDDAFFLGFDEVVAYLRGQLDVDLAYRIALRRGQFEIFSRMPDPPATFYQAGADLVTEPVAADGDGAHRLAGIAGSPGRVTGRARVLASVDDLGRLGYGDVLVTRQTDVGWTPLFLVAGAVVTEMGGPLSHSCVVAREYGKPAVVSVKQATTRIPDGAVVTVDGNAGEVLLHA
jgi:pyruvate,water dikinase